MVYLGSPTDHQIFNNTIYNNGGTCIAMSGASGILIENNICYSNGSDSISGSGGTDDNNLFGNPSFVNPLAGTPEGFQLQDDSPAIDAGTSPTTTRTAGYALFPAPDNSVHDQGAWEFQTVGGAGPTPIVEMQGGTAKGVTIN